MQLSFPHLISLSLSLSLSLSPWVILNGINVARAGGVKLRFFISHTLAERCTLGITEYEILRAFFMKSNEWTDPNSFGLAIGGE